jgi:glycosyltransferase involved in cell wall biosynthesis
VSGLRCVALDLGRAARLADRDTRTRLSRLLADLQARAPETRFPRLQPAPPLAVRARRAAAQIVRRALPVAAAVLPPRAIVLAEELALAAAHQPIRSSLPSRLGAQVVLCPSVGPALYQPGLPLVCHVESLAHLTYPDAFEVDEAFVRTYLVRKAARLATRLVCPSEFVRGEILDTQAIAPERVAVIRPGPLAAAPSPEMIDQLGLVQDEFLLCPAPFVGYANHRLLLLAFGQYRARHPESKLKLVCLGSPGYDLPALEDSVRRMRLVDRVILGSEGADGLYHACRGVVLPQLYDASGQAALTAMAAGRPVVCSDAAALREVVGDVGVYFDPRVPESLVEAIALADAAGEGYRALGAQGQSRARHLNAGPSEAEQYLRLLGEVA